MADEILKLERVCKGYNLGLPTEVEVLHDIDLKLDRGEFLALIGPSGSGKSTLLNIVGLLDRPTRGRLLIKGRDTALLGDDELTHLRGHTIGFVFQYHLLISAFTARENVMMPMLADRGFASAEIEDRADDLLRQVGLEKFAGNLANNMSGGQQQRVAVARALAMNPDLVLADEPTGNLDTKSADSVFELMRRVNRESGTSFLLVTHNLDLARQCDRIIQVVDGRIADHRTVESPGW
ncbi:lipoprotein-releasing system ATP-binding protein [Bradyrhizobium diazoefficiens]|uniref:ABC transporter ATP-binding protein n=1 Tax=Bradyrhizobium diazoefficiens TaxID=1355477 RepID=A0A0E4BVN9_9BRAD|nr:ABC transporter ATP-binding protein [Bradyrhizobium diazoefficiens]MBP1092640.1 lipoprotein-releasing system ATP-binding protein [Bradyrhizobium japonicum]MBR0867213.1 ABC transporter ATP-binding protein [Bradyrhizobium diazoefficiens]MBR0891712.1 ABC transporter ATP-binding protein [Bradyrhizobium diazoefficiens]MBR0923475.1 ABC transporter ATP-binding protein [Bradyrhizobium diazoefficiens]WLA60945.1 ABC transporter ATP-binding protein [Bradyrhizobium diazoefficiens]